MTKSQENAASLTKILKDPYFKEEAKKYKNPIYSRQFILSYLENRKKPANLRELVNELDISDDQIIAFKRRIKAMLRDGQLEPLRKRRYWPSGKRVLIEGIVKIDRGRYWVIPSDNSPKIEIGTFNQHPVYSGLKVIVSVPEVPNEIVRWGTIIEILTSEVKAITGRYVKDLASDYVISQSKEILHDIIIPEKYSLDAQDGDIVVVNLLPQISKWSEPKGKIVEILGNENTKNIEITTAIKGFGLPCEWPKAVEEIVKTINTTVSKSAIKNRVDLRNLPLVTIDGEDAKDFDDAVFCEQTKTDGFRLYVAIADVSYYVKPSTPLDKEALKRGNSVYFPGNVIPMLPEVLSNEMCSLKPNVDRLCMVCEMTVSKTGVITRYKFYEAIINSFARLTYTKVHKLLTDPDTKLLSQYEDLLPHLQNLHKLYKSLKKQREKRGAIDFDTVETRIIFNKKGKIRKIEPRHRNIAHKIIEECMLSANEATAKFLIKHKIPGVFRIHEAPPENKIEDLKTFFHELGIKTYFGKEPKSLDYGKILQKIKDRKDINVIQTILLRSLTQAVYSPDNIGHFGLAYSAYTHFTSPIRRYPDLIVHRQIKTILNGKWPLKGKTKIANMSEELNKFATHCSVTERRADDATRDVERWLKCQYMRDHVGNVYNGVISTVTTFGFFVELTDIYIDGLVHVNSLHDDYYIFDNIHHKLQGEHTKKEYKIGMEVKVVVSSVDIDERKIDFALFVDKKYDESKINKKNKKRKSKKEKIKTVNSGKAIMVEEKIKKAKKKKKKRHKKNKGKKNKENEKMTIKAN